MAETRGIKHAKKRCKNSKIKAAKPKQQKQSGKAKTTKQKRRKEYSSFHRFSFREKPQKELEESKR